MTENQLFQAARAMQSMGSFAASIGEAFFVADTHNRETLVQAFKGLFKRAHETVEALALAEAGRAIAEGCERYEESQRITMKAFNFEANGQDFGEWIAQTQAQAQDAFAKDAGYKDWANMCERADEFGGNTVQVKEI